MDFIGLIVDHGIQKDVVIVRHSSVQQEPVTVIPAIAAINCHSIGSLPVGPAIPALKLTEAVVCDRSVFIVNNSHTKAAGFSEWTVFRILRNSIVCHMVSFRAR